MKRYSLVWFGILVFLICVFCSFNRLLITDEIGFIKVVSAISKTGVPICYDNEASPLCIGLWHPPLYISLLSLFFNPLDNSSPHYTQIWGIICFFLNLLLIYFLCNEIFHDKKRTLLTSLSLFLYSISPLIIKGALLIDIDNTILTPLMTFFLFIFIRLEKKKAGLDGDILLGLLFGGILWAKFHSLFLIPTIVLYQLFNRNYQRAVTQGLIVTLVGWGFFLGSWWIYSQISQLPFSIPFIHNFGTLLRSSASCGNPLSKSLFMLGMLRNVILWASPFLFLLLALFCIKSIKGYFIDKRLSFLDFLFLYGVLIIIGYTIIGVGTAGFPRYYTPIMPALSIVIAAFISQSIPEISKKTFLWVTISLIGGVLFCLLVIGDPLLLPFAPKKSLLGNPEAVKILIIKSLIPPFFYLLLLGIIGGIIKAARTKMGFLNILTLASFLSLVSANVSLDIIQAKATYSTIYNYGEKGMKQTIEYLKASVGKEDIIICPKDVAYYVKARFFCSTHPPAWTEERLRETINEKTIKYVILRKNFYCQVNYDPKKILAPMYAKAKDFEDFEIYQRKNDG